MLILEKEERMDGTVTVKDLKVETLGVVRYLILYIFQICEKFILV